MQPSENEKQELTLPDDEPDYNHNYEKITLDMITNLEKPVTSYTFVSIEEIIHKKSIDDINDLIKIANYYELMHYKPKDVTSKDDTSKDEFEKKFLEKFIKSLNNTESNNIIEKKVENIKESSFIENGVYKFDEKYYTLDLEKIYNIKKPLLQLSHMIGLTSIKTQIIDMILYYLMGFEKTPELMHLTLEGPPGCGKTMLAKIISKILVGIGILSNKNIVYAKKTDLHGQYLGHTAQKTQAVIVDIHPRINTWDSNRI